MTQVECRLLQLLFLGVLAGCAASAVPPTGESGRRPNPSAATTEPVPAPVQIDVLDDPVRTSVSYYGPWVESGNDGDKYRYVLVATRPRGTDSVSYWVMFSNIYTDVWWRDWNRLTLADGRILEMKGYNREMGVCAGPLGVCGYSEHLRALIARVYLTGALNVRAHSKDSVFSMHFPAGYTESLVRAVEEGMP